MYAYCYLRVMCIPIILSRRHPHFNCYAEELNLVTRVYETQLDIRPTASYIRGLFSRYLLFLLPLHHTFHLHALGFEPRPKIYRIFY